MGDGRWAEADDIAGPPATLALGCFGEQCVQSSLSRRSARPRARTPHTKALPASTRPADHCRHRRRRCRRLYPSCWWPPSATGSADDRCRAAPEAHNDLTLLQRAHSVRLIQPNGMCSKDLTMQPQTTPASPPLVPPTMIGGEIPLIDVSGFLAGEAGRRRTRRRRAALRLRECRLLLSRRPRRAAGADRYGLCRGRALPCAAAREQARGQGQRAQYRLHADRAEAAAQRRRAGQEAEPERGLLPAPRARRPTSRRARQPPLPRHEQVAGRSRHAGLPRQHAGLHGHDGGAVRQAGAALCAGARPAGDLLRRLFRRAAHDPAHVALSRDRRRRRHRSPAWCRTPIPGS